MLFQAAILEERFLRFFGGGGSHRWRTQFEELNCFGPGIALNVKVTMPLRTPGLTALERTCGERSFKLRNNGWSVYQLGGSLCGRDPEVPILAAGNDDRTSGCDDFWLTLALPITLDDSLREV
jgi:hypothetical protein